MQQPQLDLRVLQYFVAVAEELHFGRAAARLHIAQPSLSVQIRKLEHSLGTPLLIRTSRSVSLTSAGDVLLGEAKRLLSAAERAVSLTREVASGVRGTLIVGFQANAAAELTPRILAAFKNNHPEIHVQMRSFDFADPTAGLADGSADVAFVRPPLPAADWLAMETLFIEPRVLVVASSSRFAGLSEVSVEQVVDESFVARKAPDKWRDFWLATQARGGQPVRLGTRVPPSTSVSKPSWVSGALRSPRPPPSVSMTVRGYLSSRSETSHPLRCRLHGALMSMTGWHVSSWRPPGPWPPSEASRISSTPVGLPSYPLRSSLISATDNRSAATARRRPLSLSY